MYTAKIQSKTIEQGVLTVHVEFTDGVVSRVEACTPQNEEGLRYWVKSRLEIFNSGSAIASAYADGAIIDVSEGPALPAPTAAEIASDTWFSNYRKWVHIKTTLIDTGILTGNETKLVQLKTKVQNDFLPAYIDSI